MEVSGQLHALADLSPGKNPLSALDRRLGVPSLLLTMVHNTQNLLGLWTFSIVRYSREDKFGKTDMLHSSRQGFGDTNDRG
jgi:hypothetical protein